MINYARLTPGPGWKPLQALGYFAYRVGAASPLGGAVAKWIAAILSIRHPVSAAAADDGVLNALRRDGFSTVPNLLTDAQITEMLAFLATRTPVRKKALADFELPDVVDCPHMMELANHPQLLAIASHYLGCAPTISTIGLRWSYPAEQVAGTQSFHRDPDDWKTLKFFTYLTDVEEGNGPHVYIAGTHLETPPLKAGRFSDQEVVEIYGEKALITHFGPRGAMFMADTAGVHKGAVVQTGSRLLLEVGYTLLPVYSLAYKPVPVSRNKLGFSRYTNRLIIKPSPAH